MDLVSQQRTAEQVIDVTQRVQAKAEGSIARAVRLELERVLFDKEARRRFLRARAPASVTSAIESRNFIDEVDSCTTSERCCAEDS